MKNLIPKHEGWNGCLLWNKQHSSGLFALEVRVSGERDEPNWGLPPRTWCTYLLGGDRSRFYRDEKPEPWVERCSVTDLVFQHGSDLFDLPGWNGGQTFFQTKSLNDPPFVGRREWKVGDDFAHLWDGEWSAWNDYDFEKMQRHIETVGDQFAEKIKRMI